MLSERSQAHKYTLFDSICRKMKKRQINNGEKVSTAFTLGQGGRGDGRGHEWGFWKLDMFCFLIWVPLT